MVIFFDGKCPLCAKEMAQLKQCDTQGAITLIDIHSKESQVRFPEINFERAMKILHGYNSEGKLLLGLDVTVAAWSTVNKHRWLKITRWPLLRPLCDLAYLLFAKHRMKLSRFLYPNTCSNNTCYKDYK
ncbi:Cell division inhibitor [Pseudoalteromonas luteoviolacea B = ATCC 29581]|nr:Cell division inhibitor [Pseudoalteromonas luteoviolacea B = ATCC 29581]